MNVCGERADWHGRDLPSIHVALATDGEGLATTEAAARLERWGPNVLPEEPPAHPAVVLLRQLRSPLIYILLIALGVTLVVGEHVDAGVIAAVLVVNTVVGFTQERRADAAVRSLAKLVVPQAHVVRDGQERVVASATLVPGDAVLLEPGWRVPADLRLAEVNGLRVDESLLTGESVPVSKQADPVSTDAPLADRRSMAYTGGLVTSGRARGLVVATGAATALGSIAGIMRREHPGPTPLERRIAGLAAIVGGAVGAAAVTAFVSGVLLGGSASEMFLTAVALAVSAVPEGLPVAVTVTFAVSVRRMARRNALVRHLPAVEALGSTTVIGSDKTGTLTENRMAVRRVWAGGSEYARAGTDGGAGFALGGQPVDAGSHPTLQRALLTGLLDNEAEVFLTEDGIETTGDPTEIALVTAAIGAGIVPDAVRGAHPVVARLPFEPERRYSATLTGPPGDQRLHVKGAPEQVLPMCDRLATDDGAVPLDEASVAAASAALASRGLRVLALANAPVPEECRDPRSLVTPAGLELVGLQGMHDPPRAGVRDAVAACQAAGIRVVMITGDHSATALSVARDVGIAGVDDVPLTGAALSTLDDAALAAATAETTVFARVAPEEKLRIVRALTDRGEVVAVTGDGVNDAPALKVAAVGIAMGQGGTDVAREAADIVLADDDFVTIAAAVEEGRVAFDNIRKVTHFLISCGAAEVMAVLVGVWLGWPLLLLPAQLLWLNLVTNGVQHLALAVEPGEDHVLRRPPRSPTEGALSRILWRRTLIAASVMAAGTLVLFRWMLDQGESLAASQTVALTTLVVFQAVQAGNVRSETATLLRLSPLSNPLLLLGTLASLSLHVLALHLPVTQYVLRVEPIAIEAWWRILAVAGSVLVAIELDKLLLRRRARGGVEPRARASDPKDVRPTGRAPSALTPARRQG